MEGNGMEGEAEGGRKEYGKGNDMTRKGKKQWRDGKWRGREGKGCERMHQLKMHLSISTWEQNLVLLYLYPLN